MSLSEKPKFKDPLPPDLLPEFWNHEERIKALFAPFRSRSVNPEDWNSKYKFWNQLIKSWASYHACCSFSLRDLNANFKRHGCTALCLPTVLQELIRNGEVLMESDFLKEPSSTWTGWTIDVFVTKPIFWSLSKVKSFILEQVIDSETKYIHIATIKELAELILSIFDNKKENVLLPLSELTKSCMEKSGNTRITENNVKLALKYLKYNKNAAFSVSKEDNKRELLVKVSSAGVHKITEFDEGVHKLTKQEALLNKNIEQLELERNEVIGKAKSSLSGGLKQVAKNLLRKKHEIDSCIEKRSAALQNVQRLLARIHDAHYDTNTIAAYQAGYNALKKFEDTGLTEDKVKDTMDDMSEILDELNEVQSVINQPVITSKSDSELEKELEEILAYPLNDSSEEKKNRYHSFNSVDLPNLADLDLFDLPASKSEVAKATQAWLV